MGEVSPRQWGYNMPCPFHFFLSRFCIWSGFKNKSDVCHVLCEELYMLNGRPHIAKLMLNERDFGVVSLILLFYILASMKRFLAFFKFLETAKDGQLLLSDILACVVYC